MQFSTEDILGPDEKIQVVLKEDSVVIRKRIGAEEIPGENKELSGDLLISTAGQLEVLTNSLSALVARDGYLSFRVNTNSQRFGVELLDRLDCGRVESFDNVKPNVVAGNSYSIACSNCTRELGKGEWTRIFELPSGNFESGDYFCHKSVDFNVSSPKKHELFYGYYFVMINPEVLDSDKVTQKSELIHCRRCLQFLGRRAEHEGGCGGGNATGIRIYNENVKVTTLADDQKDILFLHGSSLMGNFQNLVKKIVHDFEFVDKFTSLLPTMHKILIKSFKTESSKEVSNVYLLVQVMEMKLDILQWSEESDKLAKSNAMKLLYCFVDSSDKEDQLLKYWAHDQNVHPLQVSPKMFEEVLSTLRENSRLIPAVYRHSHGFDLSYVFTEDSLQKG